VNIQNRVKKLENQIRPDTSDLTKVIFIAFEFPNIPLKPMTPEMKEQVKNEIIQKTCENPLATCHLIFLEEGYDSPFDDVECIQIMKFARDSTTEHN